MPLPSECALRFGNDLRLATDATSFASFFGFNSEYITGDGGTAAANVNGDDAIELFENRTVVDLFGDINTNGTGQPWEYMDGWAYRNDNTGPDGSTFVTANWS